MRYLRSKQHAPYIKHHTTSYGLTRYTIHLLTLKRHSPCIEHHTLYAIHHSPSHLMLKSTVTLIHHVPCIIQCTMHHTPYTTCNINHLNLYAIDHMSSYSQIPFKMRIHLSPYTTHILSPSRTPYQVTILPVLEDTRGVWRCASKRLITLLG